jgi:hypothetical protein
VTTADFEGGMRNLHCGLTLEDEFVLTRIRAKAKAINSRTERDQYFWVMEVVMTSCFGGRSLPGFF